MSWRVDTGDVRDVLRTMPDASVHMACTSPPFYGLRDYGTATWEGGDRECDHDQRRRERDPESKSATNEGASRDSLAGRGDCRKCGAVRIDKQIGLERTLDEYIAALVGVFDEVGRVLRDDGTLWVNLGDSFSGAPAGNSPATMSDKQRSNAGSLARWGGKESAHGLKHKDLMMVPARFAIAMQDAGWYLRQKITWAKGVSFLHGYAGTAMPESTKDRPSSSSEDVFLFSKNERYFYDWYAARERGAFPAGTKAAKGSESRRAGDGVNARPAEYAEYDGMRNWRNVWIINPQPLSLQKLSRKHGWGLPDDIDHFAAWPEKLVEKMIIAGTSERGVCPECGAQWVRIVESESIIDPRPMTTGAAKKAALGEMARTTPQGRTCGTAESRTTGWRPSCECCPNSVFHANCDDGIEPDHAACDSCKPIPATVLDPFCGSGRSGVVAVKLGRSFVGAELNPGYAEASRYMIEDADKQGRLF